MKAENQSSNQTGLSPKKTYTKPSFDTIRLVAEEAVLALCKTGIGGTSCRPNPNCVSMPRS